MDDETREAFNNEINETFETLYELMAKKAADFDPKLSAKLLTEIAK
jgi:hypothetical protein